MLINLKLDVNNKIFFLLSYKCRDTCITTNLIIKGKDINIPISKETHIIFYDVSLLINIGSVTEKTVEICDN